VNDALRHNEPLPRLQRDGAILEIDKKFAVHDVEEFIEIVVLVPVILALHDSQTHDRIVDLAERPVEPAVLDRIDDLRKVDDLERGIADVEAGYVRVRIG